jgi:hypothetical protein
VTVPTTGAAFRRDIRVGGGVSESNAVSWTEAYRRSGDSDRLVVRVSFRNANQIEVRDGPSA